MSYGRAKGWQTKPKPGCFVDPTHPLSRGLVGCWLFNEGAGSRLADYSNFGNPAFTTNNPVWRGSIHGSSLLFNGSNNYASVLTIDALNFGSLIDFSVLAWVKINGSKFQALVDKRNEPNNIVGYFLGVNSDNTVFFQLSDTDGSIVTVTSSAVSTQQWFFVIGTADRDGNSSLYVNGVANGTPQSLASIGDISNSSNLEIARRCPFAGGGFFDGQVDDVRVYNRALLSNEIQWLYQEPYANILQPIWRKYFVPVVSPGSSLSSRLSLLGVGK
jgi:hypothetical protein